MIELSLYILASYVLAVCTRWGLPVSVSDTFFSIRHKWIFSAVMVVSVVLLTSGLFGVLAECWRILMIPILVGGVMIGCAPNLACAKCYHIHMIGAAMLGIGTQLVAVYVAPIYMIMWVAVIPALIIDKARIVFWAEMIGGAAMYAALLLNK